MFQFGKLSRVLRHVIPTVVNRYEDKIEVALFLPTVELWRVRNHSIKRQ